MIPKQDEIVKANISRSFTNIDEIEKAKRRTYHVGEISPNTGLQKQPDGSWAPPKKGSKSSDEEDEKDGPQIYGRSDRSVFTQMFFYNDHRARKKYKEKHGEEKYNKMKELYESQRDADKKKKEKVAEKVGKAEEAVKKDFNKLDSVEDVLDVNYNKRADIFEVIVKVKGIESETMLSPTGQHLGIEGKKDYADLVEDIKQTSYSVSSMSNKKEAIDKYDPSKVIISVTKNDPD